MKPHKYGAVPTVVDGVRFASKAEARRYGELKLLEKAGEIRGLSVHPIFPLYARGNAESDMPIEIGRYIADFAYEQKTVRGLNHRTGKQSIDWNDVVEDVKGCETPLWKWKRKHVEAQYGIDVQIVK